jgi:glycosyltransferase involved in cell wall biosynthesis
MPRLLVLDDRFPDLASGFRLAELGAYLDAFDARVGVWNLAGPAVFEARRAAYRALRPEHHDRILFCPGDLPRPAPDFLYAIFLDNAYDMLAWAEGHGVPFGFQLYPGGGFGLDNAESDEKLRCVLSSPLFSFVIVTQPPVRDYVADRFGVGPERLHLVGPGPVWTSGGAAPRPHLGHGKDSFDVGFVAHKYAHNVRSKGYDFFVEVARRLAAHEPRARFHVVGNYAPADHPLGEAAGRVTFHGSLGAPALERLFRTLDVVVSPNVAAALYPGNFDGFPTASCSQAALAGALIFATDPLGLNRALVPGRDFLLLERAADRTAPEDVARAAEVLRDLAARPERLRDLAEHGRRALEGLVGPAAQLAPRIELLRRAMAGDPPPRGGDTAAWRAAAAAAHRRALDEREEVARLEGVIEEARAHVDQKERNIADLVRTIAELQAGIAQQTRDLEAWRREHERLERALRERETGEG